MLLQRCLTAQVATLLCMQCLTAQPVALPLNTVWEIFRPGDTPNGENESWGIAADGLGLWWVTNPDYNELGAFRDVVVHTLNFDGTIRDTAITHIGGPFNQQAYFIATSGSRVYIGGRTCRSLDVNLRDCDMLVACISRTSGDTLWTTTIDGGFGYDEADGIAVQPNGDVIIAGWTDAGVRNWDAGIARLSPSGKILWQKSWGTDKNDHQDGHLVTVEGKLFGAGLYGGSVSDLITLRGFDGQSSIMRFDPESGDVIDSAFFGRNDSWLNFENALGMAADTMLMWVTGITTTSENNNDLFAAAYDQALNRRWYYTCCGSGTEAARSIVAAPFGQIIVVGQTTSFGAGGADVVVLQLDDDGKEAKRMVWGGPGDDEPLDCILRNSTLYIAGRTSSKRGNRKDAFLIAAPIGHTYAEESAKDVDFNVSVSGGFVSITSGSGPLNINVYNVVGEQVLSENNVSRNAFELAPGAYLIRATNGNGLTSAKKFIVAN